MVDNGWAKIHRKILEWEWYSDANTFRLFIHCVLKANHKDKKYRGTLVKRGEFLTSYDLLGQELKLGTKSVRTALTHLERTGEVARQSSAQGTRIIVKNYDLYNRGADELADEGQTSGKRGATNKNEKNEKKNNNIVQKTPKFDFQKVYDAYPKKEGKTKGLQSLQRKIKSEKQYNNLCLAVKNYAQQCEDEQRDKQFIKLFSTWANCWEDYLPSSEELAQLEKEKIALKKMFRDAEEGEAKCKDGKISWMN